MTMWTTAAASEESPPAQPGKQDSRPAILQKVGIDQRLGQQLPLELRFRDEYGRPVRLADSFNGKPVILSLVYYDCPMLCTQVLNGLTSALLTLRFNVGGEFNVLSVSIDPRETPALALAKKNVYVGRYRRPGAPEGWHFLTGAQPEIDALTRAAGFGYAWDPETKQFAHASLIMVLTPDGRLAQYFYGIEYPPRDLRLALVEASRQRIGNLVDQALLYCYHYDPATGRYGAVAMNIMRLGGVVTVLLIGLFIVISLRAERSSLKGRGFSRAVRPQRLKPLSPPAVDGAPRPEGLVGAEAPTYQGAPRQNKPGERRP